MFRLDEVVRETGGESSTASQRETPPTELLAHRRRGASVTAVSRGLDRLAAMREDLSQLVGAASGDVTALEAENQRVRNGLARISASRVRRAFRAAVRARRTVASLVRHPLGACGRVGARLLALPPLDRLRVGCERVCRVRVPVRSVDVDRQETDQAHPSEAIRWLGPVSVGGVARDALFCHPTSRIAFTAPALAGGRAVAWCALLPDVWTKNPDGVEFEITVRSSDGRWERRQRRRVSPSRVWGDRRWRRLSVALPATARGKLQVTLSTRLPPAAGTAHAFAIFGDPCLQRTRPLGQLWQSWSMTVRHRGLTGTARRLAQLGAITDDNARYHRWLALNSPTEHDLRRMASAVEQLADRPLASIITPVFNTDVDCLRSCIESVRCQIYPHWELCLADDGSDSTETLDLLREATADPRIRVVYGSENQGISGASNAALAVATGVFVALLDHDDALTPDALYEVVKAINRWPDLDMVYSDEDKLEPDGQRSDPFFKPDWSPEHFLSCMYTCHLLALRRTLVEAVGGFRGGYDGAQDYDLVLRVMERTTRIRHVPKVLYHWRKVRGSAAASGVAKPWAVDAGRRALADYAERAKLEADVEPGATPGQYRVRYRVRNHALVSVVLVGAGGRKPITEADATAVAACLRSIARKTSYAPYEVIIVHDGSLPRDAMTRHYAARHRWLATSGAEPSALAARVNLAVSEAGGEHVVICADLVEVIATDWLTAMLEYSQQAAIGAIGAKLRYPDGRLSHVGLVLGLRGVVAPVFHGAAGSSAGYISSTIGVRNYSAVSFACAMTRRAVFRELGGFDSRFGDPFADVDYCLRLRQAGYRVVFTPYAELSCPENELAVRGHDGGGPGDEMRRAWADVLKQDPHYNPNLTREFLDYRPRLERADGSGDPSPGPLELAR